ncbi:MAG: alkaline phosphatase family protein [Gammaproteobacteria bacterium]|nr:alkaline phosphatase family protein [Gammaproteobacteria bacterium]
MYEQIIFPDYQGSSIANLMQTLASVRGGDVGLYPPLEGLDAQPLVNARNVVMLVIDGLGYEYLSQYPDSHLYKHLHSKIMAVAPPTTTASVSTYLTGLAPQQHGLTGWFTYLRELGSVVTILPWVLRAGGPQLGESGRAATELLNLPSFFDRLAVDTYSVMPDFLQGSEFNRMVSGQASLVPYATFQQCFDEIARLCRNTRKKYVYAYWAGFDMLAHGFGVGSGQVASHFFELDQAFEKLVDQLAGSDTTLLVSADHGFIDAPPEKRIDLSDHPELKACLQVPLCGEPRLAYCYVRRDMRPRFEDYVEQNFSGIAQLYLSQDLVNENLYGLGDAHPELAHRTGDYTLVMEDKHVMIDSLPGDTTPQLVGYHGGLSSQEIYVPLILVDL